MPTSKKQKKVSNNLSLHLKEIREDQMKPKVTMRKLILKTRAEINE